MSATPAPARRSALEQVSQRWKTAVALGSVAVVAGFVAIVVPAAASVAVALFIGWVLVFGALVQLFDAFTVQERSRMVVRLVLAAVMAAAGSTCSSRSCTGRSRSPWSCACGSRSPGSCA